MGSVTRIRGKTEQRIVQVIALLKNAREPLSYESICNQAGGYIGKDGKQVGGVSYDVALYILATLVAVDLVERHEVPEGPGRPRVYFTWATNKRAMAARDVGSRLSA